MTNTPGFIICSASSGSTLLSNLLDRHPDIACGPELYAFNKHQIYCSYDNFCNNLPTWLYKGLVCDGQISPPNFFLNKEAYYCTSKKIIHFSREANNLRSFFDLFFDNFLRKRRKKVWVEKSGSNSYYLDRILTVYPNAKIIHITRDGRDAVSSMIKRGGGPYHAISHWLYNVAASIKWRDHPNYLEIKYENLVQQPNQVIKNVFQHLGVELVDSEDILSQENAYWQKFSRNNIHPSWNNKPNDRLSTSSIGRYNNDMSPEVQKLFWSTELTFVGKRRLNVKLSSTKELMKALGYINSSEPISCKKLKMSICKDAINAYFSRARCHWKYNRKIWLPITQIKLI